MLLRKANHRPNLVRLFLLFNLELFAYSEPDEEIDKIDCWDVLHSAEDRYKPAAGSTAESVRIQNSLNETESDSIAYCMYRELKQEHIAHFCDIPDEDQIAQFYRDRPKTNNTNLTTINLDGLGGKAKFVGKSRLAANISLLLTWHDERLSWNRGLYRSVRSFVLHRGDSIWTPQLTFAKLTKKNRFLWRRNVTCERTVILNSGKVFCDVTLEELQWKLTQKNIQSMANGETESNCAALTDAPNNSSKPELSFTGVHTSLSLDSLGDWSEMTIQYFKATTDEELANVRFCIHVSGLA